jgi:hypothetical protein
VNGKRVSKPYFNVQQHENKNALKRKKPCNTVIPFLTDRKEPRENNYNDRTDYKDFDIHSGNFLRRFNIEFFQEIINFNLRMNDPLV